MLLLLLLLSPGGSRGGLVMDVDDGDGRSQERDRELYGVRCKHTHMYTHRNTLPLLQPRTRLDLMCVASGYEPGRITLFSGFVAGVRYMCMYTCMCVVYVCDSTRRSGSLSLCIQHTRPGVPQ